MPGASDNVRSYAGGAKKARQGSAGLGSPRPAAAPLPSGRRSDGRSKVGVGYAGKRRTFLKKRADSDRTRTRAPHHINIECQHRIRISNFVSF